MLLSNVLLLCWSRNSQAGCYTEMTRSTSMFTAVWVVSSLALDYFYLTGVIPSEFLSFPPLHTHFALKSLGVIERHLLGPTFGYPVNWILL